ncbi:hypothetical protein MBA17_08830 [Streptosporangium sp. KLBMP 9127]|nr:hypothetical protein [Streptosporangium sp. KLBMP 9127]
MGGHELVQDRPPDAACEVDDGVGDDACGLDDLVAGGLQGDGEAGPVGVGAGDGGGGDRDPDELVGGQQGVDFLGDACHGAGAQDVAAEHAFLDREVGGFHLPPLVIELDQLEGGVAVVVELGGGQAVHAPGASGGGGDGDLAFHDADLDPADPGQEGAVGQAAQDRRLADGAQPGQERGAGG